MVKKIVRLKKEDLYKLIKETIQNYYDKYEIFDYSNKHVIQEELKNYHIIKPNESIKVSLSEGIIKTYPTNVTINHVYNMMSDYDIDILIPNEIQNDEDIANHIMVKTYLKTCDLNFETKLNKAFKACGYSLGAYKTDCASPLKAKIYQFEPMYQNDVNQEIGEFLYHVTTKNVLPKILKQGFTPKTANKVGFLYDGRCYFFLDYYYINDYIRQFDKTNKEYTNNELKETEDYVLIQVKTQNIKKKIKFYPDVNFPKDIAVFCYANIPPTEISNYYLFSTEDS